MEEAAAATADSQRIGPAAPVRVVARICPGGTGSIQVATRVVDSSAVVSLREDTAPRPGALPTRKDYDYRFDGCYPAKDDDSYRQIFNAEVKPLVDAIFRGTNSCVVACGASAKTHLITGQPAGLLTMAMEQILLLAQPIGAAVSVSSYQVLQDTHVFDLLEPKENEVLILEDATGRINLKGLSRVPVKSLQDFADICCCGTNMLKQPAKPSNNSQPRVGHHGFIIYISGSDGEGKERSVAKMSFLDLAAYVDPKLMTNGGALAAPNCNKATYALMNVVQALNSNQSFIPYRQSKLTRILQDSLCKTSSAVLIACLDEFSRTDVISTLNLASRSSQTVNVQYYNLGTRSSSKSNLNLSAGAKNLSRSLLPSTHLPCSAGKHSRAQFNCSAVKASQTPAGDKRSKTAMHSAKKPLDLLSTNMKQRDAKPTLIGRKLFCPGTNLSKEDKIVAAIDEETDDEELQSSIGMGVQGSFPAERCDLTENVEASSSAMQAVDSSSGLYAENSCTSLVEICAPDVADEVSEKTPVGATQSSPKLSDRLREISNSLKLLNANNMPVSVMKTPTMRLKFEHSEDSPESFKVCSAGFKKNLAKECLMYLNSANKEQLKSLKCIGEKRANQILELRKESLEPLKQLADLKNIIRMNKREIETLVSGMIVDDL